MKSLVIFTIYEEPIIEKFMELVLINIWWRGFYGMLRMCWNITLLARDVTILMSCSKVRV